MNELVDYLKAFNRKERYWLIRNALGEPSQEIDLSVNFRKKILSCTGVDVPRDAWWAIDYNLNWLAGALLKYFGAGDEGDNLTNASNNIIQGNQEDIDFIIAFGCNIILVEAKCFGGWNNAQILSKRNRISDILTTTDALNRELDIRMVLLSPNGPSKLERILWPEKIVGHDGAPYRMTLELSEPRYGFRQIGRQSKHNPERWKAR